MAVYGGIASGAATGDVSQLDTGLLNVTGSDLALITGACEAVSADRVFTLTWDPTGANQAMTGQFAAVAAGTYLDGSMHYLDNPTAANAVVRATWTPASSDVIVFGLFATAAGDITGTDTANNSFATTGTSLSATAPNAATDDLIVDFACISPVNAMTAGADQTARASTIDSGTYLRGAISTQNGTNGGVMSWTFATANDGGFIIAGRIPNAGGAALTASGTPNIAESIASGVAQSSTPVNITDVNTTESWTDGDTGLVITGTGFV